MYHLFDNLKTCLYLRNMNNYEKQIKRANIQILVKFEFIMQSL